MHGYIPELVGGITPRYHEMLAVKIYYCSNLGTCKKFSDCSGGVQLVAGRALYPSGEGACAGPFVTVAAQRDVQEGRGAACVSDEVGGGVAACLVKTLYWGGRAAAVAM